MTGVSAAGQRSGTLACAAVGAEPPVSKEGIDAFSSSVSFSSKWLGSSILDLVLGRCLQSSFGIWLKKFCEGTEGLTAGKKRGRDDIFPLPLPGPSSLPYTPDEDDPEASWMLILVASLNYMHGGQDSSFEAWPGTPLQQQIMSYLRSRVRLFIANEFTIDEVDWNEFFRVKSISYSGEEVKVARWTKWENIKPALPYGHIASISALDLAEDGVRDLLLNPTKYLKPGFEEQSVRPSRVMVQDEDWGPLARGLVQYDLCAVLPHSALITAGGQPLHNGMFGVEKGEEKDGVSIHRLIMNLIPLNSISQSVDGDVGTLPLLSQMNSLQLHPDEHLVVSSEDLKCMFYLFGMPSSWLPLLSFNRPVPDDLVPPHCTEPCYLCAKVLPMGYLNSVGIAQHLHRNLIRKIQGGPSRIISSAEVRKDRPASSANPMWRVYLDNFDLLEKVNPHMSSLLEGNVSPDLEPLLEEYHRAGLPLNSGKSVKQSTHAEVQGAEIDGISGLARPKKEKLSRYVGAILGLLRRGKSTQKQMQVVCGGLVYFAMLRRPMMSILNYVWRFIHSFDLCSHRVLTLPSGVMSELLIFLGLLPLAHMDFRTDVSGIVTASDASGLGGGICASDGITPFGLQVSQSGFRGDYEPDVPDGGVVCIGLHDDLSCLRVALELLRSRVLLHVSVGSDEAAKRVVESHFPDVIFIADADAVTDAMCLEWAGKASNARLVLVGAGSTDPHSKVASELKAIVCQLRAVFSWCPVRFFQEGLFNLEPGSRAFTTTEAQVLPYKACASGLSLARRERLYWFDWSLESEDGVVLRPPPNPSATSYGIVSFSYVADPRLVLERGWSLHPKATCLSTFVAPQPSDHPRNHPAGLDRCDEVAKARWSPDRHRFPPYQYKDCNLVWKGMEARAPSVRERERIIGLPTDFTFNCLTKSDIKARAQLHDDVRLTLIGKAWSIPVVAFFLLQLLSPLNLCLVRTFSDALDTLFKGSSAYGAALLAWRALHQDPGVFAPEGLLARKLLSQVSSKGDDVLLQVGADTRSYQRFRNSIPISLWRWREICGWKWPSPNSDHINKLELRAIYTSLRWRILRKQHLRMRFLHLTDSMVCVHILNRGRSSSRKIQCLMSRLSSLLLATGAHPVIAYVSTHSNPADRPSRRARVKRKWRK